MLMIVICFFVVTVLNSALSAIGIYSKKILSPCHLSFVVACQVVVFLCHSVAILLMVNFK